MGIMRYERWLMGLLLAAMLLPIWIGRYPPMYDYPNHLLEAQVVAHYTDPRLNYADAYEIRPGWYLRSNALSTLLLIGLGYLMPMTLAGQLVVSLYMVLLITGLWLLLRRSGAVWPLLLLAPTLAYNFTFTSGWVNFVYAAALGVHAFNVYLRWRSQCQPRELWLLALLCLLIYSAHVVAWVVWMAAIAAMAAVDVWQPRRYSLLLLSLNSALPLLLITQPALAVLTALIGPVIWYTAALLRRLKLSLTALVFGAVVTAIVGVAIIQLLKPLRNTLLPELRYFWDSKLIVPLRLFTVPNQFEPPNMLLATYNMGLAALVLVLAGLLAWSTLRQPDPYRGRWLAAIGLLGIFYIMTPSHAEGFTAPEPRILLFAVFIALASVRLPAASSILQRAVTVCTIALCLLTVGGTITYARVYDQKTRAWSAQMDQLVPARAVLVLQGPERDDSRLPVLLTLPNTVNDGLHFTTTYAIEHGGFVSRIFDNGPVRPRPVIPVFRYNRLRFNIGGYIVEECPKLRAAYDAVLFWGSPESDVVQQLNACFGPGVQLTDMAIWRD